MDCWRGYPVGVVFVLLDLMQRFLCIFLSLLGEDDCPVHQPGAVEDWFKDSARPSRMESRIPGTERRKRVS
jgi:hypothetical protein